MLEALRWMRDWGLFGGITCAVAPSVGTRGSFPLVPPGFPSTAAVIGTLTGIGVGLLLYAMNARLSARSRVAVAAVLWPPVLGGWGAGVAASAASLSAPGMEELAVISGTVAAFVQTVWFAPAYARQAARDGRRWPLLAVAACTAWVAGFAAVETVLQVIGLP